MSPGLSSLLAKPIRIVKVRAGRQKPGLKSQHVSGLSLVTFRPGQLQAGDYLADTKTAGAVCLLGQISLPCAIFAPGPVTLNLRGGTNCDMAPQIDEFTEILLPNIRKLGANFEYEVVRKGFFPKGGGEVNLFVNPVKTLNPIKMIDPGSIKNIYGWSFTAGNLPVRMAEEMTFAAIKHLKTSGCDAIRNVRIDVETYKEDKDCCPHNGSGIVLVASTSTGCILGGSALGSVKFSPQQTGIKAAEELLEAIECGDLLNDLDVCAESVVLSYGLYAPGSPTSLSDTSFLRSDLDLKAAEPARPSTSVAP